MQDLLAELLPFFAAFYLFDCVAMVRPFHSLFASGLRTRFQLLASGLHCAGIWPHSQTINVYHLPFFFTADGFYAPDARQKYGPALLNKKELVFFPFADLSLRWEQKKLFAGKRLIALTTSPAHSRLLADQLREIQQAGAGQRFSAVARLLEQGGDLEKLRNLRVKQRWGMRLLKILCVVFAFGLFGLLPLTVYVGHLAGLILPLIKVLGTILVGILFFKARLMRQAGQTSGQIASHLISTFFLPSTAVHAAAQISRELFLSFHQEVLAAELLTFNDFRQFARRELNRLTICQERWAIPELNEYWALKRANWESLLQKMNLSSQQVLAPPAAVSPDSQFFCPICQAEHRQGFVKCMDCDAPLQDFAGDRTASKIECPPAA